MKRRSVSPAFQNVCHWCAGLEDVGASRGDHDVVAEQRPDRTLEDDRELVLARVAMERRGQVLGRQRVLDNRHQSVA